MYFHLLFHRAPTPFSVEAALRRRAIQYGDVKLNSAEGQRLKWLRARTTRHGVLVIIVSWRPAAAAVHLGDDRDSWHGG
jgi:hypothetical protein